MPTQTPNLKLDTYNNTTDSQSKFQTFRTSIAGDQTSNMTKIDKWAGDVNTKLTSLENNKPTILVKANWISVGYYEAISEDIVDFKLDMLVTVKLNQDNDGTLTMKINELTVKSFLKYDTTGTLVNLDVGDLRKDREYQFRYDGTAFVWQGGTSADQLNIVGTVGNIVSVADDNTIKDSGVSVGTGALSTTDKTVVGGINELDTRKIDKTQIKNTLTETVEGGVLDATQGKILDDKFSNLSADVGTVELVTIAKNLKGAVNELSGNIMSVHEKAILGEKVSNVDFLTITEAGLYTGSFLNVPNAGAWIIDVKKHDGNFYSAIGYDWDSGECWKNIKKGTWQGWKQLATTEKIDVLCTPVTGNKIVRDDSCRINDVIYIDVSVRKIDDSNYPTTSQLNVVNIPYSPTSPKNVQCTPWLNGSSLSGAGVVGTLFVNGGVFVYAMDCSYNEINISGTIIMGGVTT